MIPNRFFFVKLFAYSDLKYIFAVRKVGAIAHPDSYREVEQWILKMKLHHFEKNLNFIEYHA